LISLFFLNEKGKTFMALIMTERSITPNLPTHYRQRNPLPIMSL